MPSLRRAAAKDPAANIGFGDGGGRELAGAFRSIGDPDLGANDILANPPFNHSDTGLRGSAFHQSEAKPKVVSAAKGNFRKDDDVRC